MACRFGRLKKHLGIEWTCDSIRHGVCERILEQEVDHLSVAEILGHANGQMVATTYQHLNKAEIICEKHS